MDYKSNFSIHAVYVVLPDVRCLFPDVRCLGTRQTLYLAGKPLFKEIVVGGLIIKINLCPMKHTAAFLSFLVTASWTCSSDKMENKMDVYRL